MNVGTNDIGSNHSYIISIASYNNFFRRSNRSDGSFIHVDFRDDSHDYNTMILVTTGVTLR